MLNEDFNEEGYVDNVSLLNDFIENISINNLSDKVVTLKNIPNGDFYFNHNLGVVPKFRIILKQIGGGNITDQDKSNSDKLMFLHNDGTIIKELKLLVG